MREDEYETLCMIIEHLEAVEELANKKFEHYFETKNWDKAQIFEGLSCRANTEAQVLVNFMPRGKKNGGRII